MSVKLDPNLNLRNYKVGKLGQDSRKDGLNFAIEETFKL